MREIAVNVPAEVREADSIAERIGRCKAMQAAIQAAERRTLDQFAALGRELASLKAACKHGEYGPALEKIGIKRRRAAEAIAVSAADLTDCESIRDAIERSQMGGVAHLGELSGDGQIIHADLPTTPEASRTEPEQPTDDLWDDVPQEPAKLPTTPVGKVSKQPGGLHAGTPCRSIANIAEAEQPTLTADRPTANGKQADVCQACNGTGYRLPPVHKSNGSKTPTLQTPGSPVFVSCRDCRVRGLAACVCRKR